MPSSKIDKPAVLSAIASAVSCARSYTQEELLGDLKLLDIELKKVEHFPWEAIGKTFGLTRQ